MKTKPKKRERATLEKLSNELARAIYKGEEGWPPVDELNLREFEHQVEGAKKDV